MTDWTDFAEYVAERRDAFVRTAYLLVGERAAAEDLVQNSLIRVWPHWQRVSSRGDPDAYVRKVIVNQFASLTGRRRWREVSADLRPGMWAERPGWSSQADGAEAIEAVDARMQLREVMIGLGPRQRAVLVLRYYLDLSEAETASILGCSVGTVKSQAAKALARLRDVVTAQSGAPGGQGGLSGQGGLGRQGGLSGQGRVAAKGGGER